MNYDFSYWPVARLGGKQQTHWRVEMTQGDTIAHTFIDFRDALSPAEFDEQLKLAKERLTAKLRT